MVSFAPVDDAKNGAGSGSGALKFVPVEDAASDAQQRAHPLGTREVTALTDVSQGLHSFASGQSLGWLDELNADEYAATVGAENAFRKLTGKPVPYGVTEARSAMLQQQHKDEAEFHNRHPHLDTALEFAGGAATPGMGKVAGWVGKGANWLTRAGRSAIAGGGIGAVAGASDERDRVKGAEGGAVGGTMLGGGLHLMGSAVTSGLPAVAKIMKTPLVETWQNVQRLFGVDDPKASAAQIAAAQKKALEYVHKVAESAKKSLSDIVKNPDAKLGKPVLGAETLGRPGMSALSAVGRRAGDTPDKLESTIRQRDMYAGSRIVSDLAQATGVSPAAIDGDFAEQLKALRTTAAPLYEVAYPKPLGSQKIQELMSRDAVKKAMVRARRIASNEGIDPETVGLTLKGPLPLGDHPEDAALQLVSVKNPTVRTGDYIKRGLDDVLETYRDKTTKRLDLDEEGRAVLNTLDEWRKEMFRLSPEYENAVAHGGEAPRQQEAYRSAPDLLKPSVSMHTFRDRVGRMTPAQQEALKGGFISDVYNRVQNGRMRLRDMQTPAFVEKARAILGFEPAADFLRKAESEMRLRAQGGRMMPGTQSATMELTAADAEREQQVTSLTRAAVEFGKNNWGKSLVHLAKGVGATVQTADLNEVTRNEVGRLLMLPPKELAKALYAYEKSRMTKPAQSFVRTLAEDPKVLDAARRVVLTSAGRMAEPGGVSP